MVAIAYSVTKADSLKLITLQGLKADLGLSRTSSQLAEYVMTSWIIPQRERRCSKWQQII
jgi:hypothetical protein